MRPTSTIAIALALATAVNVTALVTKAPAEIRTAEVSDMVAVTRPGARRAVLHHSRCAPGHFSLRSRLYGMSDAGNG